MLYAGSAFAQWSKSGNLTAAGADCTTTGACVSLTLPTGGSGAAIYVSGSYTGTLQFETSVDGTGYVSVTAYPVPSGTGVTSTTSTGTWQVAIAAMQHLRVRCSAYTTGTAAVKVVGTQGTFVPPVSVGSVTITGSSETDLTEYLGTALDATGIPIKAGSSGLTVSQAIATNLKTQAEMYQAGTNVWSDNGLYVQPATGAIFKVAPWAAGTLASGATAAITDTTSTQVIAATVSNYIYVTQCEVQNAHTTTGTWVNLQNGSGGTTIYSIYAASGGGGSSLSFPAPLKVPTAGNALYAAPETTGTSTRVSCSGFKSTVSY